MATPYLVTRQEEVASTQDLARELLGRLPVLVSAERQTAGRGRTGAEWLSAPRAVAASYAYREQGTRPVSLIAGVAAARAVPGLRLKWPNDLLMGEDKAGGILVEKSGEVVVVGMGLNLWWPDPPSGIGAVHGEDPGPEASHRVAGVWAAELADLLHRPDWPREEYRSLCSTLGRRITWDPDGNGVAVGLGEDGSLVVETSGRMTRIHAGEVRHVRG